MNKKIFKEKDIPLQHKCSYCKGDMRSNKDRNPKAKRCNCLYGGNLRTYAFSKKRFGLNLVNYQYNGSIIN